MPFSFSIFCQPGRGQRDRIGPEVVFKQMLARVLDVTDRDGWRSEQDYTSTTENNCRAVCLEHHGKKQFIVYPATNHLESTRENHLDDTLALIKTIQTENNPETPIFYLPIAENRGGKAHWVLAKVEGDRVDLYDPKYFSGIVNRHVIESIFERAHYDTENFHVHGTGTQLIADDNSCGYHVAQIAADLVNDPHWDHHNANDRRSTREKATSSSPPHSTEKGMVHDILEHHGLAVDASAIDLDNTKDSTPPPPGEGLETHTL